MSDAAQRDDRIATLGRSYFPCRTVDPGGPRRALDLGRRGGGTPGDCELAEPRRAALARGPNPFERAPNGYGRGRVTTQAQLIEYHFGRPSVAQREAAS